MYVRGSREDSPGVGIATSSSVIYQCQCGAFLPNLARCRFFITDFGTVLPFGIMFADFNLWLAVFMV